VRVSDADREAVVARLQTAVGEGRLDLDEFGERAHAAHAAVFRDELDRLVVDLPAPLPPQRQIVAGPPPEDLSSIFGDITLAVTESPPQQAATVFGDVRFDLRGLRTDAERIELHLRTVFGDVDVIVAAGVHAELHGRTVFGDRRVQLAPVPRIAGTPLVVVHAQTIFGDLRVRSLAPGESTSRWAARLARLTQRSRQPPGPPLTGGPPMP
jgi:hypothetical protein